MHHCYSSFYEIFSTLENGLRKPVRVKFLKHTGITNLLHFNIEFLSIKYLATLTGSYKIFNIAISD